MIISIPAPARGRTYHSFETVYYITNFNSRPREGANLAVAPLIEKHSHFNSRPREGANFTYIYTHPSALNFNSRPREGANSVAGFLPFAIINFNSRPREGANLIAYKVERRMFISIPAPARGRTGDARNC